MAEMRVWKTLPFYRATLSGEIELTSLDALRKLIKDLQTDDPETTNATISENSVELIFDRPADA